MSIYAGEYLPGGMFGDMDLKTGSTIAHPIIERVNIACARISLVIPYRITDETGMKQLVRLVECVAGRTNGSKHEFESIVVVDDHSPYSCDDVLSQFDVNVIENQQDPGPAGARNQGIKYLLACQTQDVIAFTDADCVPCEDWILSIRRAFNNDREVMILSGRTKSFGNTKFDREEDAFGILNGRRLSNSSQLLYGTTCNLAVSVEVLRAGFRFNEQFDIAAGEDVEFCFKALQAGYCTKFCDSMLVRHDFGYNGDAKHDGAIRQCRMMRYEAGYKRLRELYPEFDVYYMSSYSISNK